MKKNVLSSPVRRLTVVLVTAAGLALAGAALAEPPPWAPAHGYHKKGKGKQHEEPQAAVVVSPHITGGKCNREAVGQVLGGVVGGVVGSQVGKGDSKPVATVAGAVIGFVIGGAVGRSMDDKDKRCTGEILEFAEDRKPVAWSNPETNTHYTVTPVRTYQSNGRYCREFTTEAAKGGKTERGQGTACRTDGGGWDIRA